MPRAAAQDDSDDLDALFADEASARPTRTEPDTDAESSPGEQPSADQKQDTGQSPDSTAVITLPDDDATSDSFPRPPPSRAIEEIIVTATKREQSLRDIAGTVSALTGEQLEAMGAKEQEDFLKLMPGVALNKGEPNQNRITIRGVAQDFGTSQAAGTFIGDVPFTDPFVSDLSPDLGPFDLATVEVLKGPQGTLFGGSGLAGAIRYVLRAPEYGAWETKGFVAYDSVRHGEGKALYGLAANLPLFDRDDLALRVVGNWRARPGFVDETGRGEVDVNRSRQDGWRALLAWAPTPNLAFELLTLEQDTTLEDLGFINNLERRLERDSTATPSPTISNFTMDTLTVNWGLPFADLVSVTGHITKLLDTSTDANRIVPGTRTTGRATVDGYTQEIRLVSPAAQGAWSWLGGLFYMRYDNVRRADLLVDPATTGGLGSGSPIQFPQIPQIPQIPGTVGLSGDDTGLIARYDLDATAEEIAVFGETTWRPGLRWELTLGLRLYQASSEGVASGQGVLNLLLSGEQEYQNDASITDRGVNPKLAATFTLNDDISFYGLLSRGFRFGAVTLISSTPTDDIPPTYKSDTLWMIEAGVRTAWLERTLLADFSVYGIDWTDPQVAQVTDSNLLVYVDNVGGAEVKGAELLIQYLTPLEGLSLNTALAWTDARTSEPFTASDGTDIPPGSRWPFSADFQVAATLNYARPFGSWRAGAALTYTYTGPGFANLQNTGAIFDYDSWDIRVTLTRPEMAFAPELSLGVTNLTDTHGLSTRAETFTVSDYYFIQPRTWSLRLGFSF